MGSTPPTGGWAQCLGLNPWSAWWGHQAVAPARLSEKNLEGDRQGCLQQEGPRDGTKARQGMWEAWLRQRAKGWWASALRALRVRLRVRTSPGACAEPVGHLDTEPQLCPQPHSSTHVPFTLGAANLPVFPRSDPRVQGAGGSVWPGRECARKTSVGWGMLTSCCEALPAPGLHGAP